MAVWQKEHEVDIVIKIVLFLVSPFFSMLYSLRRLKTRSSYIVLFLFIVFFGIAFTVPDNRVGHFKGDGVAYRLKFENFIEVDSYEFNELFSTYKEFDDGDKDFYTTIVSFIVSRFTSNYHWVFAVYAFVFGFFMLKSLRFLTSERRYSRTLYNLAILAIFVMSNFIFNINGVRFWTASWIGVYAIFQIFLKNNKLYFILAAITPLIHVSFIVFLLIITIAFFFRQYEKTWFILFILSFFISSASVSIIKSAEGFFPPFIANTIGLYTDSDAIARRSEETLWFVKLFAFLTQLVVNITMIIFYRKRDRFKKNNGLYSIFLFLLVWMTFVNFTMVVPSLGKRFFQLSLPFIAYIWLLVLNRKKYSKWLFVFTIAFSLSYYTSIKSILLVTDLTFYISSPFYIIYNYLL